MKRQWLASTATRRGKVLAVLLAGGLVAPIVAQVFVSSEKDHQIPILQSDGTIR